MKKSIAAVALTGIIALTGAMPAVATNLNYNPAPPNATVSDGTVAPGETFTFAGTGFLAGETITITVTSTSAQQTFTTTAAADGSFAFPLSIREPGTYTLTATGGTSGKTATQTVTVSGAAAGLTGSSSTAGGTGSAAGGTGGLADTGADPSLVLWSLVGGGALVAGAASVVVVRRRANAEASA